MDPATKPNDRFVDHDAPTEERTWALFMHLSVFLAHIVIIVIPALVLWLIKRNDSHFLDDHGREAINFQLSLVLYALAVIPLAAVLTCGVGVVLYLPLYALAIVGSIQAAMASNRGEYYRYPMCIRFISAPAA